MKRLTFATFVCALVGTMGVLVGPAVTATGPSQPFKLSSSWRRAPAPPAREALELLADAVPSPGRCAVRRDDELALLRAAQQVRHGPCEQPERLDGAGPLGVLRHGLCPPVHDLPQPAVHQLLLAVGLQLRPHSPRR